MAKDIDALRELFHTGSYVKFPLKNCLLEWAVHLHQPDTAFDPVGKYHVQCIIGDDVAAEMKEVGFNVKKNKDDQYYVKPTRKPDLGAPIVKDKDGNPLDARKIGNGSIATVKCSCKSMKVSGTVRLPIYIEEVIVEELVEFEGGDGTTGTAEGF